MPPRGANTEKLNRGGGWRGDHGGAGPACKLTPHPRHTGSSREGFRWPCDLDRAVLLRYLDVLPDEFACEVGSGGGLDGAPLRTVRNMTVPLSGALTNAENDLRTAQSEADPHRQGQYARSAVDAAAEASLDAGAGAEERERAQSVLQSALTMIPGSLLREAQSILTTARSETDPHKRRELARSALAKAREAAGRREVTDEERAQARQVIGSARMMSNTTVEAEIRQRSMGREREREVPDVAL